MKPQGTFKPESIEQFYSSYAEKHGAYEGYEDSAQSFSEAYDFTTCERPDGSKYGTGGQCRKGKETTPGSEEKPKRARKKAAKAEETPTGPVPPENDVKEMTDRLKKTFVGWDGETRPWTKDHQEVWDRVLATQDTKALGSLTRKLNKEVFDNGKYDVNAGFLKNSITIMKDWLQANQRSGVGAKREAERANMTPEELRRANTADAIQRGIRGGVVNPRMR